jgi:hypothetical protein
MYEGNACWEPAAFRHFVVDKNKNRFLVFVEERLTEIHVLQSKINAFIGKLKNRI